MKLLPKGGIPEHFKQESPLRALGDFDANEFFDVLKHIQMMPGYTLDYVYNFTKGFGGYPCLYARALDEKPFSSFEQIKPEFVGFRGYTLY